jgi:hypothetical protein
MALEKGPHSTSAQHIVLRRSNVALETSVGVEVIAA